MLFSKRLGFQPIDDIIQIDYLNTELRNRMENVIYRIFENIQSNGSITGLELSSFDLYRHFIEEYFKENIYENLDSGRYFTAYYRDVVIKLRELPWFSYYDIFEVMGGVISKKVRENLNRILEEEQSGYRMTKESIFIPVTDKLSLEAINQTEESPFDHAKKHISLAIKELGNKDQTNYNAVIREAITATESYMIQLADLPPKGKATMGDAVKKVREKYSEDIQMEFIKPFETLYGIASNKGIRHAGNDKTIVSDREDAILVLTTCSAMLNYLSSKVSGG